MAATTGGSSAEFAPETTGLVVTGVDCGLRGVRATETGGACAARDIGDEGSVKWVLAAATDVEERGMVVTTRVEVVTAGARLRDSGDTPPVEGGIGEEMRPFAGARVDTVDRTLVVGIGTGGREPSLVRIPGIGGSGVRAGLVASAAGGDPAAVDSPAKPNLSSGDDAALPTGVPPYSPTVV